MDARAAALLASCRHGSLATLLDGAHPYASLVACAADGKRPIFLLSELAEHTRNLRRDPRASLLLVDAGDGDPLARRRRSARRRSRPPTSPSTPRPRRTSR